MIKIIGGIKKRTTIQVPVDNVRPTSAQKRESIFSSQSPSGSPQFRRL